MKFINAPWLTGAACRLAGHDGLYRHDQTRLKLTLSPAREGRCVSLQGDAKVRVGKAVNVEGWRISASGHTAKCPVTGRLAVKSMSGAWYLAK
jgi:hypothetical protein